MSILGSIKKSILGKRLRNVNDELNNEGACLPTPCRRSSPPGAFPGTEEYAPIDTPTTPNEPKRTTAEECEKATPKDRKKTTSEEEREKVVPKSKTARGLTSGIRVDTPTQLAPATTTSKEETPAPKRSRASRATQEDTQETIAPIATLPEQPIHQRRQNLKTRPYGGLKSRSERHQLLTSSLSRTLSLKGVLADSNSPIAKAHKRLVEVRERKVAIDEECSRFRDNSNNIFLRRLPQAVIELETITGYKTDTAAPVDHKSTIEQLTQHGSEKSLSPSPVHNLPSSPVHNLPSSPESPESPKQSSSDDSATSYPSTGSGLSRKTDTSLTITNSSLETIKTEMFNHFAAQNETLSKKLEQVSETLTAQTLKFQEMQTQMATRPPSIHNQPQPFVDKEALEQRIWNATRHCVTAEVEKREQGPMWAPQAQPLTSFMSSLPPIRDYFNPQSTLRKNRAVLPIERSRAILEAQEIQYRYALETCPFQKLLGHKRITMQEASMYTSLKQSVIGQGMENYPSQPTMPKIVEPSAFDLPMEPLRNDWAHLQAPVPARREPEPMDFEVTGAPAVNKTWKRDQDVVFKKPQPMDIDITGPPAVNKTWRRDQDIRFKKPQANNPSRNVVRNIPAGRIPNLDKALDEILQRGRPRPTSQPKGAPVNRSRQASRYDEML